MLIFAQLAIVIHYFVSHTHCIRLSSLRNQALDSIIYFRQVTGFCELFQHETLSDKVRTVRKSAKQTKNRVLRASRNAFYKISIK
jgi:hypothetical protein